MKAAQLCSDCHVLPNDKHISFLLSVEHTGAFPPPTMLLPGAKADGCGGQDPTWLWLLRDGAPFSSHQSKRDQYAEGNCTESLCAVVSLF